MGRTPSRDETLLTQNQGHGSLFAQNRGDGSVYQVHEAFLLEAEDMKRSITKMKRSIRDTEPIFRTEEAFGYRAISLRTEDMGGFSSREVTWERSIRVVEYFCSKPRA
jgi:hypothetical protein